jgi:hypothetical protein
LLAVEADLPYDVIAGGHTPMADPRGARAVVAPHAEAR